MGQSLQAFGNDRGARGAFSPFPLSPRAGPCPPRAVDTLSSALTRTAPPLQWDYNCFTGRDKTQHKHSRDRTRQHPEASKCKLKADDEIIDLWPNSCCQRSVNAAPCINATVCFKFPPNHLLDREQAAMLNSDVGFKSCRLH